jgi:hypothetical protein
VTTDLQPAIDAATVERVLLHGDLQKLAPAQKVNYYKAVCDSVGLNPLTQPFAYIVLNGKEVLYARREATEQLRKIHKVSIEIRNRELVDGIYVVTARATLPDGRTDENIGAVPLPEQRGEVRANSMMKAETKAKRRVTLSICGLGMLDETEVESLPIDIAKPPEPESPNVIDPLFDEAERVLRARKSEPVPPDPMLPPGPVLIVKVESRPTKNPSVTRHTVTFSDGARLTTINDFVASLAEECAKGEIPVYVKSKQSKFGPELVALKRADEAELPLEPPLSSDDIPF